jgi:hypothetical protein
MTAASLDVVFPVGGIILELQPCCTGVLWVKTLSRSWTSDGGTFGIVPSLEASSLETQRCCGVAGLCPWRLQPVSIIPPRDKLEGCCRARVEAMVVLVAARGCHMVDDWLLVADRGGWCCLATVSAAWDCVGGWRLWQRHHGRLGLQRTVAGCLAWLGAPGAVQRRKIAQATFLACCYGGGG